MGPDEYVATCGDGLYRTPDAEQFWTRLDTDLNYRYFREAFEGDGQVYAAAARSSPGTWNCETGPAAIRVETTDTVETFEAVSYPGGPNGVVLAWAFVDGTVLAGMNDGRLIRRAADGAWTDAGHVPAGIRSLEFC